MNTQLEFKFDDDFEFKNKLRQMDNIIKESGTYSTFYITYNALSKKFFFTEREYASFERPDYTYHIKLTPEEVIQTLRLGITNGMKNYYYKTEVAILLCHFARQDPYNYTDYSDLRAGKQNYEYFLDRADGLIKLKGYNWYYAEEFDEVKT